MCKVGIIAVIVVLVSWHMCLAQNCTTNFCCNPIDTCAECFNMLANEVVSSSRNQRAMQEAFFPPTTSSPIFVVVTYSYDGGSQSQTWYWSASTFYALFNPLLIHQYISLFFGNPEFLSSTLNLELQEECSNADVDTMRLLTQRVSLSTYISVFAIS